MRSRVPLIVALLPLLAHAAEPLSNEAIYFRCYGQMARGRPAANDPRLVAVRAGTRTGPEACGDLLASARLGSDGQVQTPTAKAVLKTFQDFHALWFPANDFNELPYDDPNYDLYDIGEAALHVTHALFSTGSKYSEVVTANRTYEAARSTPRAPDFLVYWPTAARSSVTDRVRYDARMFRTGVGTPWAPKRVEFGTLNGIRPIPARRDVLSHVSGPREVDLDIHRPLGGGIAGTIPYLLLNLGRYEGEHANGGLVMPRRWSKAVLKDLLCRELPMVRATDALPLVEPASDLSFRTSPTCMQCHGTMDALAGVIRGVGLVRTAKGPGDYSYLVTKHIVVAPPADPADPKPPFESQSPTARVYFRDLNGTLVDQNVTGLDGLGAFLATRDDLYVCAAKRYYAFFTGVDVRLQDPADPGLTQPTGEERRHLDEVRRLGAQLREDQNLQALIGRIFALPVYASPTFEVAP